MPSYLDNDSFKIIWSESIIGFALVSIEGHVLEANPYFCSFLEYTEQELIDKHFKEFTHPEDIDEDSRLLKQLLNQQIRTYFIYKRYITKTGKVKWVLLHVDPVQVEFGQTKLLLAQIMPVSYAPGKAATSNLVSPSKRRNEAVIDATSIGALIGSFLKKNFKWVLPMLSSIVGFLYFLYTEFMAVLQASDTHAKSIDLLNQTLEKQQEVLESLMELVNK